MMMREPGKPRQTHLVILIFDESLSEGLCLLACKSLHGSGYDLCHPG